MLAWLALLALTGGASRTDEVSTIIVRVGAVLVLAATLWAPPAERLRRSFGLILFAVVGIVSLLIQLIPLPPSLWARLPGRGFYAHLAHLAGVADVWRPATLTPDLTVDALLALLPAAATLLAVLAVPREERPRLALPLLGLAVGSAVLGLLQLVGGAPALYMVASIASADGIFANRNHEAAFLACAIVLVGLVVARARATPRWQSIAPVVGLGVTLFLLVSILAAGSRAGLLVGALAGAASAAIFWLHHRRPTRRGDRRWGWRQWWAPAAAAIVAAGLLGFAVTTSRALAVHRLADDAALEDIRAIRAGTLEEVARVFFPVGSGYGSFAPVFQRFEPVRQLKLTYVNHAHNEPLQLAIEGGLPGVLLAAIFLIWFASACWSIWRRPAAPGDAAAAAAQAGTVIVALTLLSSLADYPLRVPLFATLFVIACIWVADGKSQSGPSTAAYRGSVARRRPIT